MTVFRRGAPALDVPGTEIHAVESGELTARTGGVPWVDGIGYARWMATFSPVPGHTNSGEVNLSYSLEDLMSKFERGGNGAVCALRAWSVVDFYESRYVDRRQDFLYQVEAANK